MANERVLERKTGKVQRNRKYLDKKADPANPYSICAKHQIDDLPYCTIYLRVAHRQNAKFSLQDFLKESANIDRL